MTSKHHADTTADQAVRAGHKRIDVDDDLLARRDALKMRSEYLRHQLSFKATGIQPAFRATDRVAEGLGWVKAHPGLVAAAGAALLGAVVARPRAFMRLGTRAFAAWQMVQRVQPMVRAFTRRV
ncbi:hypothetical protein FVQ98_05500 [Ottowia sp. GY511]|uniref:YqjK family protein n=1 Tax=Ottowia flava TaxID=2675430 RepID=A0ABW4KXW0_9BURK|nr:YqjK family protein [Ottowia sp. GY511]TXK31423.1 hypothetical protein FVQ98_05500 [Ottowia sp. GY511]